MKAAAAGVPVVGFAAGGVTEAVVHEKTGLLVPAEDVAALQAAIARLADDPELRKQFAAAGQARMRYGSGLFFFVQVTDELVPKTVSRPPDRLSRTADGAVGR